MILCAKIVKNMRSVVVKIRILVVIFTKRGQQKCKKNDFDHIYIYL